MNACYDFILAYTENEPYIHTYAMVIWNRRPVIQCCRKKKLKKYKKSSHFVVNGFSGYGLVVWFQLHAKRSVSFVWPTKRWNSYDCCAFDNIIWIDFDGFWNELWRHFNFFRNCYRAEPIGQLLRENEWISAREHVTKKKIRLKIFEHQWL